MATKLPACALHGGSCGGDSNRAARSPSIALRHLSLLWQPASAVSASQRGPPSANSAPEAAPLSRGLSPAPCLPAAPRQPPRPPPRLPPRRLTAQRLPFMLSRAPSAPAPAAYAACARLSQGLSRNGGPCRGVARRTRAGGRAAVHHARPHERLAGREPPPFRCHLQQAVSMQPPAPAGEAGDRGKQEA